MFNDLWQEFITLSGYLDKDALKALFAEYHLAWLWSLLRDQAYYFLNINIWLFGVAPALLLQYLWPIDENQRTFSRHFFFDALYPVFFSLISVVVVVDLVVDFYSEYLPFMNIGLLDGQPFWIQAIGAFLIMDLMAYVHHRLMHENRFLWQMHKVHHSAVELNPLTVYRAHPVEEVARIAIRTLPIAVVGGETSNWIVFILIDNFWVYYIHASTRVNLGWVKYILVTPQYHRVHHSANARHYNKNYSTKLVLWDWLFNSMHNDFTEYPEIGIAESKSMVESSKSPLEFIRAMGAQFFHPFIDIYRITFSRSKDRST